MKKVLRTSAIALLLSLIASTSALGATPPASAVLPADGTFAGIRPAFTQTAQMQETAVDQLERARLQQVLALIKARQPAEVDFAGTIGRSSATGQWTIAGVAIGTTTGTVYDGGLVAGLHAHVRAQIHRDGALEALHVRTITHAAATSTLQHAAEWQRDDHGIHLGEANHSSSGEHGPAHPAAGTTAGQQASHATPETAHHAETPAEHQPPAQPQPAATQQATHHDGGASHGEHSSGHH